MQAIFALENHIPALLFAGTEYYRLKGEALRTAFGIPVPLNASPDMAHGAIADQLKQISRSSWARGMTSADVDAWLDRCLPREGSRVEKTSIVSFDCTALGLAG